MNRPLRYEARAARIKEDLFLLETPKLQTNKARFEVFKDGSRFSVRFYWNDETPVLFLDRWTHMSSILQMINEAKRRLGDISISVDNPFTSDHTRKFIR